MPRHPTTSSVFFETTVGGKGDINSRLVTEIESNRQLEVQLDGSALVAASQSVKEDDIDFRAIEGTVTLVEGPLQATLVQTVFELLESKKNMHEIRIIAMPVIV